MAFNIADIFERAVDLVPDRMALICGDAAPHLRRARRAGQPRSPTPGRPRRRAGEHVGIYAPNCAEWVETMLGCFKLRAVPINVNFRYVEDELRYIFDNADLVAVVYDPAFADRLDAIAADAARSCATALAIGAEFEAAGRRGVARARLRRALPRRPLRPLHRRHHRHAQGRDVAPGGRVHGPRPGHRRRHRRTRSQTDDELAEKGAGNAGPVVMLMTPPLMHGAAQWGTLGQLFQGNTIVLLPKFDAEEVWHLVEARASTRS